jgi:hypothetical protein
MRQTTFKNEPEVIVKSVKAIHASKAYKHVKHFMKALNNNNIGAAPDSNNNSFSDSKNRTTNLAEFEDSFHDDLKSKLNIILQSLKEYKTKNSNNNNDNNNNYNVVVHSSNIVYDSTPATAINFDTYSADHFSSMPIDVGSSSSSKKIRSKRKAEVTTASTPVLTKKIKVEHDNDTSIMSYAAVSKAVVAAAVAYADSTDSKPDVSSLNDAMTLSNVKKKKRRTEVMLLSTKAEQNDVSATADGDNDNDDAGKLKSMKKLLKQQHKI